MNNYHSFLVIITNIILNLVMRRSRPSSRLQHTGNGHRPISPWRLSLPYDRIKQHAAARHTHVHILKSKPRLKTGFITPKCISKQVRVGFKVYFVRFGWLVVRVFCARVGRNVNETYETFDSRSF